MQDSVSTLPIEFEFDHVGIAVHSLDEGEKFYLAMGYKDYPGAKSSEVVESEKVKVRMFELANQSRIELLEPTSPESTIAKFLEKRGPGIHHICLRVKDVRKALDRLKQANYRLVHDEPFKGAHNCLVAFVHPSSTGGVLLELSQPMA
jgi:methylmalonyl-CoA/ethylmalonyl-CoA epimerase